MAARDMLALWPFQMIGPIFSERQMSVVEPGFVEKRVAARARSLLPAHVTSKSRKSALSCVLRNISPDGARIDMAESHLAPSEFDIVVPRQHRTYRARTAWRTESSIGVRFVDADRETGDDRGTRQMSLLNADNERLRRVVHNLRSRIQQLTGGEF